MKNATALAAEPTAMVDPVTCRICQGKSGHEVRDGRSVCDVCLGLVPGVPMPDDDFEVDQNLTEKKYICPQCGVINPGTRLGRNITPICPNCIREKRTEGQLKTFSERKNMNKSPSVNPAADVVNEDHAVVKADTSTKNVQMQDDRSKYNVIIDLTPYSDVYLAIFRHAFEKERTIDAQVRWWLRRLSAGETVSMGEVEA